MQICEITYDSASATDNMAIDATMLDFGGKMGQVMWRLYGWDEPAITFGYSQNWSWIQAYMHDFEGVCIRRTTGGGIVDHRHDLTYALSLPPVHPLHREPATNLYRDLHQHIAGILLDLGFSADVAPCSKPCGEGNSILPTGICFEAPEPYDVIQKPSGVKVAGAAMKRNQSGILIQGSLDLRHLPGLSQDVFEREFGRALAHWLDGERIKFSGHLPLDKLIEERDRFSSKEWNQKR